ncbi:MAG: hypothetical protein H6707_08235 [Deltaproteobacteria bacterium]|nr:hypothetical protein [Deltaproteobacteria bacterium]
MRDRSGRAIGALLALLLLHGASCDYEQPTASGLPPCNAVPAAQQAACPPLRIESACAYLASCGILAGHYLGQTGAACSSHEQCGVGQCIEQNGSRRCRYHYLDYAWCVRRLTQLGDHPCSGQPFSADQRRAALQCIVDTPCGALGLQLRDKLQAVGELDLLTCNGGRNLHTATVCDLGMLNY